MTAAGEKTKQLADLKKYYDAVPMLWSAPSDELKKLESVVSKRRTRGNFHYKANIETENLFSWSNEAIAELKKLNLARGDEETKMDVHEAGIHEGENKVRR